MPIKKDGYYISEQARYRFKLWLFNNNLSISKFAKKCGVSHQYINAIINGKIKITDTVIATFKKGGYELI